MEYFRHSTAIVEDGAEVGEGTHVWHCAHLCAQSIVGVHCNIGQNVFVDNHAIVGDYCKLQNNVNVYNGVMLEDYVFCGPSMTFTNVKIPRCKYPRERGGKEYLKTLVREGASIGAQAVIICGVTIGKYAVVGSGTVVAKDVADYAIVVGNPGVRIGWACECGEKLFQRAQGTFQCHACERQYTEEDGLLRRR